MASQWENLLKNAGIWEGSFTQLTPDGAIAQDIPSRLVLEAADPKTVRMVLTHFPPNAEPKAQVFEFQKLSRGFIACSDGAFSQGSMQWGTFANFGAELGLIAGDARLRLVELYNRESHLDRLTLIRETRTNTTPPTRPPLTLSQLLGEWRGEATTYYPDGQPQTTVPTGLTLTQTGEQTLEQELRFGVGATERILRSVGAIGEQSLHFTTGPMPYQVLLLPNGASANCPRAIVPGHPFFLEAGWLVEPHHRLRLIRRYQADGSWANLTWVEEFRV